jgi:hypothetical protein
LIDIFDPIDTCGLGIVVLRVMVPQKYGFPFEIDDVNLSIEVLMIFKTSTLSIENKNFLNVT